MSWYQDENSFDLAEPFSLQAFNSHWAACWGFGRAPGGRSPCLSGTRSCGTVQPAVGVGVSLRLGASGEALRGMDGLARPEVGLGPEGGCSGWKPRGLR